MYAFVCFYHCFSDMSVQKLRYSQTIQIKEMQQLKKMRLLEENKSNWYGGFLCVAVPVIQCFRWWLLCDVTVCTPYIQCFEHNGPLRPPQTCPVFEGRICLYWLFFFWISAVWIAVLVIVYLTEHIICYSCVVIIFSDLIEFYWWHIVVITNIDWLHLCWKMHCW